MTGKKQRETAAEVSERIFEVAARVVAKADRENPADAVLRAELGTAKNVSREMGREISRVVFAFFRWRGWVQELQMEKHGCGGMKTDVQRGREVSHEPPLTPTLSPSDGAREHQTGSLRDKAEAGSKILTQLHEAVEVGRRFAERPESFSAERLVSRAVPEWTQKQVGISAAWVRAIQGEPKLWLRARGGTGEALARRLRNAKAGPLPDAVCYAGREDLFGRPEFHAGEFEIQDIASQAVGWLCAPQAGETWWDACAGEGGKTLHLSNLMENKGLIWASDRAEWRLKNLKQRAGRAQCFNYRLALWDGRRKLPTKTKFDGVLVDAPCSGIGTWQRNPHARWTTTAEDVVELGAVQERLLEHAAGGVKPGGKLVYAVCTLASRETSDVVRAFERRHPEFEALPMVHPFQAGSSAVHPLWLWPQQTGGNGMFVAAWRRRLSG